LREQPPDFATSIASALKHDYLLPILITSQTQARHVSTNLPYGLGKSTLMLELAYKIDGGLEEDYADAYSPSWNEVFDNLFYWPGDIARAIIPQPRKQVIPKACIAWDAVQMAAGAENSVPTVIRKLASYLSEVRPEVKVILMSAPNISSIAAPLRKLVAFELIVWKRACWEVQKISARKNYKDPRNDRIVLTYLETARNAFGQLPNSTQPSKFKPEESASVQKRYDTWRATMKLPARQSLIKSLDDYEKRGMVEVADDDLTPEERESRSAAGRALARRRWVR
jgi:hypothetical protein